MSDVMLIKQMLDVPTQKQIIDVVSSINPGFYTPTTAWNQPMRIQINCLGKHWSARSYRYYPTREDYDNKPCAPIPAELAKLAAECLASSNYLGDDSYKPFDICIVNWYSEANGRLGLHQDRSESKTTLETGYPVLSISIGASAEFLIGGLDRKDPVENMILESGDVLIFGRSKRLAFHGVNRILLGTTPKSLGLPNAGRFNLTFRLY